MSFHFQKLRLNTSGILLQKCNFRTVLFPWYEYSLGYELSKVEETFTQKWNKDYDIAHLKSDTLGVPRKRSYREVSGGYYQAENEGFEAL